jgi:ribosome recycling factor
VYLAIVPTLRNCGDKSPLPNTPSRYVALKNHRDNLNFEIKKQQKDQEINGVILHHFREKISNPEKKTPAFLSTVKSYTIAR